MTFTPTPEQEQALAMFRFGDNLAIEAGAGTGKTSTLRLIAGSTPARGQYLAFNRAIVQDAKASMPETVQADTAHALAFRQVGKRYAHRLKSGRQTSTQIARLLDLGPLVVSNQAGRKVLQPGYLAGLVNRAVTIFCQTADAEPGPRHVPYIDGIDLPDSTGRRTWANNDLVRAHIADAITKAWADAQDPAGRLRFRHEHYLKMWQLSRPTIHADYILFDEAQDASPVMLDVVARQEHAQLVFVGDSQQQIYEFTGAVNALAKVPAGQRTMLTQSFRFGPAIADVANLLLADLPTEMRLAGSPHLASTVDRLEAPDCVLTRTNAAAVNRVLTEQKHGRTVHLVGGGSEVVAFAEAAERLMAGQSCWHPELACFDSWGEVAAYVANDPNGSELALLVKLVDDFGTDVIRKALGGMTPEADAEVIVSTAHKAKGREWARVQLADDFTDPRSTLQRAADPTFGDGDLRLLYVAVTRAREVLDVSRCEAFGPVGAGR